MRTVAKKIRGLKGRGITCQRCGKVCGNAGGLASHLRAHERQDALTRERQLQGRQMWSPKRPEVKEQCASCPFRDDLEARAKFHAVLCDVAVANGHPPPSRGRAEYARVQIKTEDAVHGDFFCHLSVYEPGCETKRPVEEWLQCKGASDWYRAGGGL